MGAFDMRPAVPRVNSVLHYASRAGGLAAALLVSTALTAPVFADGGASGSFNAGGGVVYSNSGGSDQATSAGNNGGSAFGYHAAGGGGGGAGATGGSGGASARGVSAGVPGGAGGATAGANGGNGGTDSDGSGSGGGGGAHGFVGSAFPISIVMGGDGGNGGNAVDGNGMSQPAAGGGGAGGYGAVVTGDGTFQSGTLSTSVTGGNGGNGGAGYGSQPLSGGSGGSGGIGLLLGITAANGGSFTISGAVTGGNGGAGGAFGGNGGNGGAGLSFSSSSTFPPWLTISSAISGGNGGAAGMGGVAGAGGAGFVGANAVLLLMYGGSITGGTSGLGQQANAVEFTGGANALLFNGLTSQLSGNILNNGTVLSLAGDGTVVGNVITGSGAVTKIYAGTVTLTGINTYTGATTVDTGTLNIQGAINGTSSVTVKSGATLTGSGNIGSPLVTVSSGATFAAGNGTPGSATSIVGNLVFQSGATYVVQVNPSAASYASVTGAATLGGAGVNAVFANGSYISKTYTILSTTGGVSGTFAANAVNTNLPANFHTSLSYDANKAYLNLALNYTPTEPTTPTTPTTPVIPTPPQAPSAPDLGRGLSGNQQAVAGALINSFNANGGIPLVYGALTQAGLTQASGELGASSQQTTFGAMGQFMGMLTGSAGGCASQAQGGDACFNGSSSSGVLGYADESSVRKRADQAFAMFTKAQPAPTSDPRWSTWVMGFGGSQTTDGNAITGSNTSTSSIYGTAVGADYRFAPGTVVGFALAGGGTNFNVANGGSGRSDLFQAGAYVRHNIGAAYVSAAVGYGWQNMTTDRAVAADRLRANFDANAWSGRVEGGYRLVAPWGGIGVTPYAAVQVTAFNLPAYAEQVVSGTSTFALNYASRNVTDTRTELGLRADKAFAVQGGGVLTLRGRLAWAHDYNPDRAVAATFQALPGASFVVNGAAQAADAALTTASAEMKWANGWSAAATFEGEFSNVSRSYGGRGLVRYSW